MYLLTLFLFCFLLLPPHFAFGAYDLRPDNLDYNETLTLQKLQAVFGQDTGLPRVNRDRSDITADQDATMFIMDIRRNWDNFSPMFRDVAKDYFLTKPPLILSFSHQGIEMGDGAISLPKVLNLTTGKVVYAGHILPNWVVTANFNIEWGNSLSSSDSGIDSGRILNCSNGPPCTGIPDIVDKWADYFEEAWTQETGVLGYMQPTGTEGYLYDIYIANTGDGIYGNNDDSTPTLGSNYLGLTITYCDYEICKGDISTSSSYVVVNNNIWDTGTMRATSAHEFFHAIQFSYPTIDAWFSLDSHWWIEATATWMEEVVHDDVNSYYTRVRSWLNSPYLSLKNAGNHEYADVIFIVFLTDVYLKDKDFVRYVWENGDSGIEAMDSVLNSSYGLNFESAFREFVALNAVAGRSSTWGGYEEGAQYGSAAVTKTNDIFPVLFSEVSGINAPQELGSSYIKFLPPDNNANRLIIEFDGANWVNWGPMVVRVKSDGSGFESEKVTLSTPLKYGCHVIDDFGATYSEVFLVAAVLADPGLSGSAPYYYRGSINGTCPNTNEAYLTNEMGQDSPNNSNKNRCFIATAAFGSAGSPYVRILQDFRDKYLFPYSMGRKFVRLYYIFSPPIADFIVQYPPVAYLVRITLLPVIGVAFLLVKTTLLEKIVLIIFVFYSGLKYYLHHSNL